MNCCEFSLFGFGWRARVLRLVISLALIAGAPLVQAIEVRQAKVVLHVSGDEQRKQVTLPYSWDAHHRGIQGTAEFSMMVELSEVPIEPWTIYFLRLGNAYEVRLNGMLIERMGDMAAFGVDDYALQPRLVDVPANLLTVSNSLTIRIRADAGRRGGVPVVVIGSKRELLPVYNAEHRWRVTGSGVVVVVSVLAGLMALLLWATQPIWVALQRPQRDRLYLFAALAEFCWAFRVGVVLVEDPPLPWRLWQPLSVIALGGWVCFMIAFCAESAGWSRNQWMRLFLWFYAALLVLFVAAVTFAQLEQQPTWLTLWYGLLALPVLPFTAYFLWHTAKHPTWPSAAIALAISLNVGFTMRDFLVLRLTDAFGQDTLARYSSVVFALTLAMIVLIRFRESGRSAHQFAQSLTLRVAEKERQLLGSYKQLEVLARAQERHAERQRILQDMHDGVGAHITSAIRQLESGRANTTHTLQTLRDGLDQLKLSIDSMNVPPGDLSALLANFRYRLEPRLIASGISLQWAVSLIEPIKNFETLDMRHVQFLIFEAISNVLQHAKASILRLEARPDVRSHPPLNAAEKGVLLRLTDNGCGFNVDAIPAPGLRSINARAAALGATVGWKSSSSGTVLDIWLPDIASKAS